MWLKKTEYFKTIDYIRNTTFYVQYVRVTDTKNYYYNYQLERSTLGEHSVTLLGLF